MRKRLVFAALLLALVGVGCAAWTIAGLPPARYVLRYGLSPGCEPTGEKETYEGVTFVEIGPGIFRMGSTFKARGDWLGKLCAPFGLPWGEQPEASNEMPVHWVEFRRGFWIATTEITNAQYEWFQEKHERNWCAEGDDDPVVDVSWEEARDYCAWLAAKANRPMRLPSEAEWECACRAGGDGEFTFGDDEADLTKYAWYDENSDGQAHAVATKRPNRWGLSDLHGNVWEWCEDTYHGTYKDAPTDGSAWTEGGVEWEPGPPFRVFRGGGWVDSAGFCRSAYRLWNLPGFRAGVLGFRPAFVPSED